MTQNKRHQAKRSPSGRSLPARVLSVALACALSVCGLPQAAWASAGDAASAGSATSGGVSADASGSSEEVEDESLKLGEDPQDSQNAQETQGVVASVASILAQATSDAFQVSIDQVDVWFTVTDGDSATVAVGRSNTSGGTNYAIDADYEGELVIPETVTYGGTTYTVTAVQDYAFSGGGITGCLLTAVEIPATVTEIGKAAFMSCGLESVAFAQGGSLETIGVSAFQRCMSLEEVEIPASVATVSSQSFSYCTSLTSVVFASGSQLETVGTGAFMGSEKYPGALTEFAYPAATSIAASVLAYQTSLQTLTFEGDEYEAIGERAFYYCSSLEEITIPQLTASTFTIGTNMMVGCSNLKVIKFAGDSSGYYTTNLGTYGPFYGIETIESVVFYGPSWAGTSSGMMSSGGLFPDSEDIDYYYNISFYETRTDAENGVDELGSIRVRSDVTVAQVRANSFDSGQVFDDGGAVPETEETWTFENDLADDDTFPDSCWAYAATTDDIASCTVSLNGTMFAYTGYAIDVTWTLTSSTGDELVEGTDFEASIVRYDEDADEYLEQDASALVESGDYTITFTGIGDYAGTVSASFSIGVSSVDWDCLTGANEAEVAAAACASVYDDADEAPTQAIVVGEGDGEAAVAALAVSGVLNMPILVTEADALSEDVAVQIRSLGVTKVIVLGDTDAVSADVVSSIQALSTRPSVSRISTGSDAGAALYAAFKDDGLEDAQTAYLVMSDDATLGAAIGCIAYDEGVPILFCDEDGTLAGSTRSVLKTGGFSKVIVVGGSSAGLSAVKQQVSNSSISYSCISATSSSEVALSLASDAVDDALSADGEVSFVIGSSSAECAVESALAAWYAAATGSVLLLADDTQQAQDAVDEVIGDNSTNTASLYFVGTRTAVPQDVVEAVCAVWYAGYSTFSDVGTDAWYAQYINMSVDAGYFSGYSTESFGPQDCIKRCDVAVVIWRAVGSDGGGGSSFSFTYTSSFTDVDSDAYYATAVNWCATSGIFTGDSGTTNMRPNDYITREELAAVMMRFLTKMGVTTNEASLDDIENLLDGSSVAAWASGSMGWAYSQGIITGHEGSGGVKLDPKGNATRAQMAKIIVVACEAL